MSDVATDPLKQKKATELTPEAGLTAAEAAKTLDAVDIADVKEKVSDVQVTGDGDMFQLLCKASSEAQGWMKSTKAMYIKGCGCVVQVTTQQKAPDGSYGVAEALTFVPGVRVAPDGNGGRKLVNG
jgi:hypothetical protein